MQLIIYSTSITKKDYGYFSLNFLFQKQLEHRIDYKISYICGDLYAINGIFSQPWVTTTKVCLYQDRLPATAAFSNFHKKHHRTGWNQVSHIYYSGWRGSRSVKRSQMQRNTILEMWQGQKSGYLKAALTVEQNLQASVQKHVLNLTLVSRSFLNYVHMYLKCQGERQSHCFTVQIRAHSGRGMFSTQPYSSNMEGPIAWFEIYVQPSSRHLS